MNFRKTIAPEAKAMVASSTDTEGGANTSIQAHIQDVQSRTMLLGSKAAMIVAGVLNFPTDLPQSEQSELGAQVRTLHRKRLIELIARAIARDIRRQHAKGPSPLRDRPTA